MPPPLTTLDLPIPKLRSGKVREVFDLGETLLFVATDRLSAFDCILPDPIPDKGAVLNQLSAFWFQRFTFTPNHMIALQFELPPGLEKLSRATDAPFHDRAQNRAAAGGVCRAGLSRRLGLEGISGERDDRRAQTARRIGARLEAARAALHALHEKRSRARSEHRRGTNAARSSARRPREKRAT